MSMFAFDFSLDEDGEPTRPAAAPLSSNGADTIPEPSNAVQEIAMDDLIQTLPPVISFTTLQIPEICILPRRDLFDARFQLISQPSAGDEDAPEPPPDLAYIDAPSDLVPGVYEGGLKTWECSLDLASHLASITRADAERSASHWIIGKRILEIGCGTSIPSLYLFHELFQVSADEPAPSQDTEIYFQDYNRSAIELMTLPNILLTWYLSPASALYRAGDPSTPGEPPTDIHITPTLIKAFQTTLKSLRITLHFFSGAWSSLLTSPVLNPPAPFDIVLSSETIYQPASLQSLISVLRAASGVDTLCLVAAKVVYFGVGGGVSEFVSAVEAPIVGGKVETVWEKKEGVGRRIMHVTFPSAGLLV